MSYCVNCGESISDDQRFCGECGTSLTTQDTEHTESDGGHVPQPLTSPKTRQQSELDEILEKAQIYLSKPWAWPVIAIGATLFPWVSVSFGAVNQTLLGVETDAGIGFLFVTLVVLYVAVQNKGKTRRTRMLFGGGGMVFISLAGLGQINSIISEMRTELEGNPFGGLVGADVGFGLYLAIIASVATVYMAYRLEESAADVALSDESVENDLD